MDLLLNLRRTVRNFPDAPAIVDGDVRMTWRDYDQDTRKLAAGLVELGLRPGDRVAVLVPTMINALLHAPNLPDYDLSSLQHVTYGASPIPVAVLKKAMELLPCRLVQAYGMTEASPVLTVLSWEAHLQGVHAEPGSPEARRLSSGGQPIIGVEVRIVGEEGQEVAAGEIGEIVARGPNVMKGYWNQAEETAYGLRAGWLHTGDLATRDDHQFVFVVDRKKDMIISGGENVYSTEVENALYAHPAVLEAVVIGVPDPTWGERVHAVVVLKPGQQATTEELIATCRELIAGYKVPRSLEFTDALPKSGAGKILKRALREPHWEGQARRVN